MEDGRTVEVAPSSIVDHGIVLFLGSFVCFRHDVLLFKVEVDSWS